MFKNIAALLAALVLNFSLAHADVAPKFSEISLADANAQCSQVGTPVGLSMETTTATAAQFYVVACARPDGSGGTTFVPAWSASGFDNANARCGTDSYTTGLAAGTPAGQPLYISASTTDIFLIICNLN